MLNHNVLFWGNFIARELALIPAQFPLLTNLLAEQYTIAMSAIALAICLFTLGNAAGVREGTLISALLIGNIVRFMIARYPVFQKTC